MRVHHHIRGGGTGGAENNNGNGDPGGVGPGGGGGGEGGGGSGPSSGSRGSEGNGGPSGSDSKLPPAKKQRIVKGRLAYVAVEEVEGRLDEDGIGNTSRQAEDDYQGSQRVDYNPHTFLSCTLASRGAAGNV
ncbi:hypothetical protein BCR33DRAFT_717620, partial [Rhizoclosmatium globosum]